MTGLLPPSAVVQGDTRGAPSKTGGQNPLHAAVAMLGCVSSARAVEDTVKWKNRKPKHLALEEVNARTAVCDAHAVDAVPTDEFVAPSPTGEEAVGCCMQASKILRVGAREAAEDAAAQYEAESLVVPAECSGGLDVEGHLVEWRVRHAEANGVPCVGVVSQLRRQICGPAGATTGFAGLTVTSIFEQLRVGISLRRGEALSSDVLELLEEEARRLHAEVDLGIQRTTEYPGLTSDEWLHYLVLRRAAPGNDAMKKLNELLSEAIEKEIGPLTTLLNSFDTADTYGDGRIRPEQYKEAFEQLGIKLPQGVADVAADADGCLDYFEFAECALGVKPSEVFLAYYDLSGGVAQWVPAALLGGHKFEGVWHTALVAFGSEWYYSGTVVTSKPGTTIFGTPLRVERLGLTLRTREELSSFLITDLYSSYSSRNYDVLLHNCNHFSNEVAQFLLRGKQIPQEVLMQPAWAKDAAIMHLLRPALNKSLGGAGVGPHANRIDDMTFEWRSRIRVGDMVLHRKRYRDRPRVARILAILKGADNDRLAKISCFSCMDGKQPSAFRGLAGLCECEVVCHIEALVEELWPCGDQASGGPAVLRASLTKDRRIAEVLHRARTRPLEPVCTRGLRRRP
eukprot:TRINITY_DN25034_c0_g1_i2.p1 TRINITY_DN25034_c0_g1~~TRINITY_DN25034_c0_g1_i2.p1  ORF type:complete len:625 (-),score=108.58 TRINITY_DN25034_c0_g1_i2:535-2409(-)